MILSLWTDRSGQTVETLIRLLIWADSTSVDPDQTAPEGGVSGSPVFVILSAPFGHLSLW